MQFRVLEIRGAFAEGLLQIFQSERQEITKDDREENEDRSERTSGKSRAVRERR